MLVCDGWAMTWSQAVNGTRRSSPTVTTSRSADTASSHDPVPLTTPQTAASVLAETSRRTSSCCETWIAADRVLTLSEAG